MKNQNQTILEERICACGCKKTFKCLPSSPTRYCSRNCMEMAGIPLPDDKRGMGRPPKSAPPRAMPEVESL